LVMGLAFLVQGFVLTFFSGHNRTVYRYVARRCMCYLERQSEKLGLGRCMVVRPFVFVGTVIAVVLHVVFSTCCNVINFFLGGMLCLPLEAFFCGLYSALTCVRHGVLPRNSVTSEAQFVPFDKIMNANTPMLNGEAEGDKFEQLGNTLEQQLANKFEQQGDKFEQQLKEVKDQQQQLGDKFEQQLTAVSDQLEQLLDALVQRDERQTQPRQSLRDRKQSTDT